MGNKFFGIPLRSGISVGLSAGIGKAGVVIPPPLTESFFAPLLTSLVPTIATNPTPTYTRASTAYVSGYAAGAVAGASQLLISCAAGEARFQGARRVSQNVWSNQLSDATPIPVNTLMGYQSETARTNGCLQSQNFSVAPWVVSGATITSDVTVAPDGTTTADLFTSSAGVGSKQVAIPAVNMSYTEAQFVTYSVYAKKGTANFLYLCVSDAVFQADWATQVFDLNAGTLGETNLGPTNTIANAKITALSDGWYRCSCNIRAPGTPVTDAQLFLGNAQFATGNTFDVFGVPSGAGSVTLSLWGMQTEFVSNGVSIAASSYIPTTTVGVTRSLDSLSYNVDLNSSLGSMVGEHSVNSLTDPSRRAFFASGTVLVPSSTVEASATNLSVSAGGVALKPFTVTPSTFFKVGGSWDTAGARVQSALNGTVGTPATATTTGFTTTTNIGTYSITSGAIGGTSRNIKFYAVALTDAQLITLTS